MSKERIKATVKMEAVDFPATTKTAFMSTIRLSKYVNTLFRAVFKDYIGCKIYPVSNDAYSMRHPVRCDLYFTLGSDNMAGGTIAAFKTITGPVKANVSGGLANYTEMIGQHNARLKSLNTAEITQDAIDIIHPLLWKELSMQTQENPVMYNKKGIVREQQTPMPYNIQSEVITPVISNVDINAIMQLIFNGNDDESDNAAKSAGGEYMVTAVRSIAAVNPQAQLYVNQNAGGENYLYNISKLDKNEMMDLMNEIGYISRTGNADCYTDSF